MASIVFDIETGPREWKDIEQFYEPPAMLPPFNESMVAYGNTKDEAKRLEKYNAVKEAYNAKLAAEEGDRVRHKAEFIERAALDAVTGQVLAIGLKTPERIGIIGEDGENEEAILEAWWGIYKRVNASGGRLVGWNSNGFDIPFLVRRSWYRGVQVPESIFDKNRRYLASTFVDLMLAWQVGGRGYDKIDAAARFLGVGQKPEGVNGAHFSGLWLSGQPESRKIAIDYLSNDLDMTWAIGERMGLL